ncbi:TetR family transcriptional regulator [Rothia dentocariosa]|nr:TetR family transcriptional regulator [Rothia dentocariosa]
MTTPASASEPRATRANNSREQILDAYEHLLVQAGERAATLDAVAAQAKVSKGGLLLSFRLEKGALPSAFRPHPHLRRRRP